MHDCQAALINISVEAENQKTRSDARIESTDKMATEAYLRTDGTAKTSDNSAQTKFWANNSAPDKFRMFYLSKEWTVKTRANLL